MAALTVWLLTIASVAGAKANYNFVPISGVNAQTFVYRMDNGGVSQTVAANGISIVVESPVYHPELEDRENFPGMETYVSFFGIEGSRQYNGGICFYVDTNRDCVFALQIVNSGDPELSNIVLLMIMEVLGLNENEATTLIQTQNPVAETWCQKTGRKIILITDQQNEKITFLASNN